jgi:manganese transport protein
MVVPYDSLAIIGMETSFSPEPAVLIVSAEDKKHFTTGRESRLLGAAFVAAIAYIDPGNYVTNIQAGAQFGYRLLWVVLAANLIAVFVQLLSSKLGLVTRSSLASLLRDHLPPWAVWLYWGQAEIIAMFTDLAEFVGAAVGFQLLLGMKLFEGAICVAVLSYLILMLEHRGLKPLELAMGVCLGIVAVAYLIELVLSRPSPRSVLVGTLLPRFAGPNSVYISAGILGATVMPHVIYLHSALSRASGMRSTISPQPHKN